MWENAFTECTRLGFKCSLDDFGSGYSSLGLLREFDVDTIKLDRRFFLDISQPKAEDVLICLTELGRRWECRLWRRELKNRNRLRS